MILAPPPYSRLAQALAAVSNVRVDDWASFARVDDGASFARPRTGMRIAVTDPVLAPRRARALPFNMSGRTVELVAPGGVRRVGSLTVANEREAWEILATRGLVPIAWLDDPARGFLQQMYDATDDGRAVGMIPMALWPGPCTIGDALAFAIEADGLVQAEALAREAAAGVKRPADAVAWRLASLDHIAAIATHRHAVATRFGLQAELDLMDLGCVLDLRNSGDMLSVLYPDRYRVGGP